MQQATPEMVEAWKAVFDHYRPRLSPNKKTGPELLAYIQQKYSITELTDDTIKQVVADNVTWNKHFANKLPIGRKPVAKGFFIEDTGAGNQLYENQDHIFKGNKIVVGIDLETAFFMVEGSSRLWDELFAFRGLDEDDLTNFYLVAEYISCLEKRDNPDRVQA